MIMIEKIGNCMKLCRSTLTTFDNMSHCFLCSPFILYVSLLNDNYENQHRPGASYDCTREKLHAYYLSTSLAFKAFFGRVL